MTWSVVWTLLPNGFEPLAPGAPPTTPRRARLSLVASLRNAGPGTTLGASPLARWPTFVANLGPLSVVVNTGTCPAQLVAPATVVSPAPDQALWDRLFAPTTPVDAYKDDAPIVTRGPGRREPGPGPRRRAPGGDGVRPRGGGEGPGRPLRRGPAQQPHGAPHSRAPGGAGHPGGRGLVGSPAGDAGTPGTPGTPGTADRASAPVGPLEASARAVQQAQVSDLLAPGSLTQARIDSAAAILRQQGQAGAATAAPLAPVLRRLRLSGAPPAPAQASRSNGTPSGATNGRRRRPPPPRGAPAGRAPRPVARPAPPRHPPA